ncbi:hypothetical protein F5148DRAFT_694899 [Russula earlei]|uniref:Uncharacterized protein n=1 Tax=Russula earlei TaxID=71964 RepID=A0ACC0UEY9_9AGAM|nr:hypothetical protein F5148DRAFT_694899 [Russula earlei]
MSGKSAADLIQSNSQIYRVHSRRLANPADADIFINSARRLTTFFSDPRAYYAEAQQPIVDILEVAHNSLKTVLPSVFSRPGFLDRSVIPAEKAPLFDAFDKLVNSVTLHVSLFNNKPLRDRLLSFLSSIGVALPPGTTNAMSPHTTIQNSGTPSTGLNTARQIQMACLRL